MPFRSRQLFAILTALIVLLAACAPRTAEPGPRPQVDTPAPSAVPSSTAVPAPTATSTLPPPRALVVCLGQEPSSLYVYKSSTRATWSVLEAVYDGPYDTRAFSVQPVILDGLPNPEDGSASIVPVSVEPGEDIVDADGNLSALVKGVRYLPSGCLDSSCAATWDGGGPVEMERLNLSFTLKPGLKWSDGAPLTAADSLFSFNVSADAATPTLKRLVNRTAFYQVMDDLHVMWMGLPGFFPQRYETFFWLPLPKHAYGSLTPAQMLEDERVNRAPLGWGPYQVDEWVVGDHITLSKNPNYFRADEGLPKLDKLVFRFPGQPADNNQAALLTGECDLVDQTGLADVDYQSIFDLREAGKIQLFTGQGPEWEHLDFGIKPASYDDYYYPGADRADFFGDVRTRKAVALCINRQAIVDDLLYGLGIVPASYIPPQHPLFPADLQPLPYDPQQGMRLLEEVGWMDEDNDPSTPRTALGIQTILGGTPFSITYLTTRAPLRQQVAARIAADLAGCGIQVQINNLNVDELYAAGPDGPLFGRKFDLAEFAWDSSVQPPCALYESAQIPHQKNGWLGGNVTGYANPDFDTACRAARLARSDQPQVIADNHAAAMRLLAGELPSIPLFFHVKMAAARPGLCGFEMDVTARSQLWGIENIDICQP